MLYHLEWEEYFLVGRRWCFLCQHGLLKGQKTRHERPILKKKVFGDLEFKVAIKLKFCDLREWRDPLFLPSFLLTFYDKMRTEVGVYMLPSLSLVTDATKKPISIPLWEREQVPSLSLSSQMAVRLWSASFTEGKVSMSSPLFGSTRRPLLPSSLFSGFRHHFVAAASFHMNLMESAVIQFANVLTLGNDILASCF